jgi:beta-galactosidase
VRKKKASLPTQSSHDFDEQDVQPGRRQALKSMAALAAASLLPRAELTAEAQVDSKANNAVKSAHGEGRSQLFDTGWHFYLGNAEGAERPEFSDASWRALDLPHDWSIEDLPPRPESDGSGTTWEVTDSPLHIGPFDSQLSPGQTATGFVLGGTGWYRKRFRLRPGSSAARVEILFDGVYMNSDVWLNGQHLGNHPYGYTSFAYDITPHLTPGRENVLAVRVRNESQNSRWYSGSGIYRHVWLTVTGPVRIPAWGVCVTTPDVAQSGATVKVATKIENHTEDKQDVAVRLRLVNPDGMEIVRGESSQEVMPGVEAENEQTVQVSAPRLWSPATPQLYRAEIELAVAGKVVDRTETTFGIRKIEVDAERGLRINGEALKLKGGCLHHANGVLGAAAIDRAEERRVQLMKAQGFNAIRTSHNPPSPAFLDACDREGIAVIDEAFDMWEAGKNPQDYHLYFDEWWQRDLDSMLLRDRNHPSVILWSIGNEIHERADPKGVEIAKKLVDEVKRLDATRPVTMAVCHFWDYPGRPWKETAPAFRYLDVGGYNYQLSEYEPDHVLYPQRVIAGTESFPMAAFDNWQAVESKPYVIGDFVWTGMDYLGETGIGHSRLEGGPDTFVMPFPWFNSYCGDIDLIGQKKPQSYYRDVVWGRSQLEMAVQRPLPEGKEEVLSRWGWSDELRSWTWPGFEGRPLKVRVYSAAETVRLLLNGKTIDEKPVSAGTKLTAEFEVPYAPGELKAVALQNGKELASLSFRTVGKPAKLRLVADRSTIRADRNDLVYVTVEALDRANHLVPDATVPVSFSIAGVGELAAVGSANPKHAASFRQPRHQTFHGKCLAVLRPRGGAGSITLRAEAAGLAPATATVHVGQAGWPRSSPACECWP